MMSVTLFEDFLNIRNISQERKPTIQTQLAVARQAPCILLDSVQVTVG